ncbi:MAG: AraC family transcriptional regulator [Myxococcales bacterium]|nr:AraC family transcriptional regulator [Myxococcales bacterium]
MYATATVPGDLAPWVQAIWYSEGRLDAARERVLPAAAADIVANLGAPIRLIEGEGPAAIRGTTTSGLLTRPLVLHHPEVHRVIGLQLHPLGVPMLLGLPLRALNDRVVALADVLQSGRDELVERCVDARTPTQALARAIAWLRARLRSVEPRLDPVTRWAVEQIERGRGQLATTTLQRASGYGATRFRDRFVDVMGIGPKVYARLVRFRRLLDELAPDVPLAQLAHAAGLVDQAHLNREFRQFSGQTPTEILAARYPSGLTVAEA